MSERRPSNTPFVLIIRDGWGENPNAEHREFNAVELADTPVDDRLRAEFPTALIHTSGESVGVPEGTTGNSEVGHQNLGAGRIVFQDSVRISHAIRDGAFFENETLIAAVEAARKDDGARIHLMGIASDAGVHGRLEHLYACLDLCRRKGVARDRVLIHLFTDGRDTGPFTGRGFVEAVEAKIDELGVGRIVSVMGRYWAMDRDNRWERTERAYNALTGRELEPDSTRICPSAPEAVQRYYDDPVSDNMRGDEFIEPTLVGADFDDAMSTRIRSDDSVIFYNYRGDRPRQIVRALAVDDFFGEVPASPDSDIRGFDRGPKLGVRLVTMASYDRTLDPYVEVAFPRPPKLDDITGDYLSRLGLTQFRCAETEKYAHVTFFFNDYREEPFEGEHRRIVQSPKVKTYDLQPEMSAAEVRDAVIERLHAEDCEDVIVVNFANPDMVGHTGNLDAAIKAVEFVDACVGAIVDATINRGGSLIVTADHGNAEQMYDPKTDGPHTAHTLYDVRLFIVGSAFRNRSLRRNGKLADVMPTAFDMLGLEKPQAMSGETLLV